MAQSCIFCGEKADSKEHAIPKWMGKRWGLRGRFLHLHETVGHTRGRKQPISMGSHRRRIFCAGCQRHFKHLEDAVIPFLAPMGLGKPVTLTAERQNLLAEWGAKTAYALITSERGMEELVPEDHRYFLREHGKPATEVYVGYAAWSGDSWLHVGESHTQGSAIYAPELCYGAVFCVEKLCLKVFGITETRLPGPVFRADRPSIKQVWPPLDRLIHWPPSIPFGDAQFQLLVTWVPI